jgi:hypothetical protein
MEAHVGDEIIVEGTKVGQGRRRGQVTEVLTGLRGEYYRVRWEDGRETVFFPSSDARVVTDGDRESLGS